MSSKARETVLLAAILLVTLAVGSVELLYNKPQQRHMIVNIDYLACGVAANGTIVNGFGVSNKPIQLTLGDIVTIHVRGGQNPTFRTFGFFIQGMMDMPVSATYPNDIVLTLQFNKLGTFDFNNTIFGGSCTASWWGTIQVLPNQK